MYERFTDQARKCLQLANQEAQRFSHAAVSDVHLLIALVKEGSGVAANVLMNMDVDLARLRAAAEQVLEPAPDDAPVLMGKLPHTPQMSVVVQQAIAEASVLHDTYVGTEHLLLSITRFPTSPAGQVLTRLGASHDRVRAEVLNLLEQDTAETVADEEGDVDTDESGTGQSATELLAGAIRRMAEGQTRAHAAVRESQLISLAKDVLVFLEGLVPKDERGVAITGEYKLTPAYEQLGEAAAEFLAETFKASTPRMMEVRMPDAETSAGEVMTAADKKQVSEKIRQAREKIAEIIAKHPRAVTENMEAAFLPCVQCRGSGYLAMPGGGRIDCSCCGGTGTAKGAKE